MLEETDSSRFTVLQQFSVKHDRNKLHRKTLGLTVSRIKMPETKHGFSSCVLTFMEQTSQSHQDCNLAMFAVHGSETDKTGTFFNLTEAPQSPADDRRRVENFPNTKVSV